jgi:hypothetical protein
MLTIRDLLVYVLVVCAIGTIMYTSLSTLVDAHYAPADTMRAQGRNH